MRILSLNIILWTLLCTMSPGLNAFSESSGGGQRLPKIVNYEEFVATIKYPPECRKLGIEGRVLIRLLINAEGRVVRYRIISAPDDLMKKVCVKSIKQLKFLPARDENNKAVPAYVDLPIIFDLTKR